MLIFFRKITGILALIMHRQKGVLTCMLTTYLASHFSTQRSQGRIPFSAHSMIGQPIWGASQGEPLVNTHNAIPKSFSIMHSHKCPRSFWNNHFCFMIFCSIKQMCKASKMGCWNHEIVIPLMNLMKCTPPPSFRRLWGILPWTRLTIIK